MSILSALQISRRPAAAFAIVGMFWGCFAAYVPVIKAQLGASDGGFGVLLLGSATGLVSSMLIAPRADRVLGARSMQVGAVLLACFWLLPGEIQTPLYFVVVMGFIGLSSGLLDVVMNARVSELEAVHNRSLMNANHAVFSMGYAVSAVITGLAREAGLPPTPVFAGFGLVAILLVPMLKMEAANVAAEDDYTGTYPLRPIVICGVIVLVAFMSEAAVEAWSALHIERTLGGGAVEGALGPAMLGFTMMFGRFYGQVLTDKFRETQVIIIASIVTAIGAILAAIAPNPAVAYVGFGTLGLGVSVIGPMGLALIGKLVAPHLRTEAIGRCAVIGFSGFFFAPMLMGLLSDTFGLRYVFLAVALQISLAVPLAILASRLTLFGTKP